jgi:hypothetical protein
LSHTTFEPRGRVECDSFRMKYRRWFVAVKTKPQCPTLIFGQRIQPLLWTVSRATF